MTNPFDHITDIPAVNQDKYYVNGGDIATKFIKDKAAKNIVKVKRKLVIVDEAMLKYCKPLLKGLSRNSYEVEPTVDDIATKYEPEGTTVIVSDYTVFTPNGSLGERLDAVQALLRLGFNIRFVFSEKVLSEEHADDECSIMHYCRSSFCHKLDADEKRMKAELHTTVEGLVLKGRSKLDPHYDEIKNLLAAGTGVTRILEVLRLNHNLKLSRPSLYNWMNRNDLASNNKKAA